MKIKDMRVRLNTVDDVNGFASLASRLCIEADVHTVTNGRHVVPADSLLGMMSLDLTQELLVIFVGDDDRALDQFIMGCESAGWIVK